MSRSSLSGCGLPFCLPDFDDFDFVVLGIGGALLHVLNHGIFKSLLFLGAGSVIHAAGTREIDRLGGLARTMPATAILFLTGAVAICGLPPLNGFVSEFLIYLGFFTGIRDGVPRITPLFALAAPALALIGGLFVTRRVLKPALTKRWWRCSRSG